MRSGNIKESQLISSSFYKETHSSLGHSPHQARFGGAGYWSPFGGSASIDGGQFLQISFKTPIQLKMVCSKMFFFLVNYLRRYLSFQDSHPWKGGRKRKKKTLSSFIILLKAECNEDYNVYTMMCSLVCFISDRNTRKTKLQRTCQDVWCLDKYQRRCVEEGKRIASKGLE